MIRINRRLLLITLIVVPLTAVSLFALNRFQVSRQGSFFIAQGKKLSKKGDYAGAITNYRIGESLGKRDFDVYHEWARCLQATGNHDASHLTALKAEQYKAGDPENVRLLAQESLAIGRFNDATKHATALLALSPEDSDLLLLRARSYVYKRDFQAAIDDYMAALALPDPKVAAHVELAMVYTEFQQPLPDDGEPVKTQIDKVIKVGEKFIDPLIAADDAPLENWLAHGEWYLWEYQKQSISTDLSGLDDVEQLRDTAARDAQEMIARYPESSSPFEFAIRVAGASVAGVSNDFEKAYELATSAIDRFPNEPSFYVLAASNALELNRLEVARDHIKRGLDRFPDENRLLSVLALVQLETKEIEAGGKTVARLKANGFDPKGVAYLEAKFLAASGKHLDAVRAFESLRQQFSESPETQKQLDVELSRCFKAIGKRDQQINALRRACSQDSGWLAAREELAIALLEAGRVDEATEEYRGIAGRYQRGSSATGVPAEAVLNLARLLVMQNSGRLDRNAQLEIFKRAISLAEEVAQDSEESGQKSQASDDYRWLAGLKEITQDTMGAEAALKKSMELDPSNVQSRVAWVRFLASNARIDESRTSLREFESTASITDQAQILILAETFASLEMQPEAVRMMGKIDIDSLKDNKEYDRFYLLYSRLNPDRQQRLDFLSVLTGDEVSQEESSQDRSRITQWARRKLAMQLISNTGNPEFEKANALVQENLKEDDSSVEDRREDRRIEGLISAYWKGDKEPSIALKIFESLMEDEGWKPQGDDLFLIGELYWSSDNWERANAYFLELLADPKQRKPRYLKRYAAILIKQNDLNAAEAVVDLLRGKRGTDKTAVQDVETAELLAEVRYQRGQLDTLFQDLLGEDRSKPEAAWFAATVPTRRRFEMMTSYLTKLKNKGEEEAFQKYNSLWERMGSKLESSADFPGAFYSMQLLERKEYANAITALDRVIESATTDELVLFAEGMLIAEGVPPDQLDRLDQLISKLDLHQDAAVLGVIVARLKETRGDFSSAERIYRGILESNPENAVVLNNLANLNALREVHLDEALIMVNKAIELKGPTPMLLDTRGICHLARKDFQEALKDLRQAVAQFPHPLLRFHLAWALADSGQSAEAKLELQKALESGLEKSMTHVLERDEFDRLIRELKIETGPNQ